VSYFRISDQIDDHPQFFGLSDRAFRVWIYAGVWCQRHLTDGKIPKAIAKGLHRSSTETIAELVAAELLVASQTEYTLTGYLKHNDSRETVQQRRAHTRERIDRWRSRGRNGVTNASTETALQTPLDTASGVSRNLTSVQRNSKEPNSATRATPGRAGASSSYVFRGQRIEITAKQWDTLTRGLPEEVRSRDWFEVWSAWDREAESDPIYNLLPWLRDRLQTVVRRAETDADTDRRAALVDRQRTWREECDRLHGGTCGHLRAHEIVLARASKGTDA